MDQYKKMFGTFLRQNLPIFQSCVNYKYNLMKYFQSRSMVSRLTFEFVSLNAPNQSWILQILFISIGLMDKLENCYLIECLRVGECIVST